MGELEKLGGKYKIALRLAKDPRFERIPCNCKGCYADDCITNMVKQWRCFIVATCDKELRGRIRKIPGVPCMYISGYKYTVEVSQGPGLRGVLANEYIILTINSLPIQRMPEAFGAPR
jgi:rRNA-processing protein FCF1